MSCIPYIVKPNDFSMPFGTSKTMNDTRSPTKVQLKSTQTLLKMREKRTIPCLPTHLSSILQL